MTSTKVSVLYISYDGMTDPLGQSQVIPYLAGLSEKNFNITLISCEKPGNIKLKKNDFFSKLKSLKINWIPLKYTKWPPFFSTVWDIYRIYKTASRLHKINNFQIVHCRSYISTMVGLMLKKKYGVKFIFDMRGFWADERVDGGLWNLKNVLYRLIYKYFKKQEQLFLKNCDAVVSLTEAGKKEMESWEVYRDSKAEITVIPCSADFSLFKKPSQEQRELSRQYFNISREAFVLSYLGSLGTWYMLDEMLDLFQIILDKHDNAIFLFLTPDDPEMIYNKAIAKGIDKNKIIVQMASRTEIVNKMCISDLSVFFIKPCYSKIASSPTKLGELLAMEIPIICNGGVGDIKEIINSIGGGIVIDDFNKESYNKAIESLTSMQPLDRKVVRQNAQDYYDLQKAVNKYAGIYNKLL